MILLISILLWIFTILGYVIYNLYKKNVKLEEMVIYRDEVLTTLSITINESNKVVQEIDKIGAFKSDDEIGFFFNTVKQIQETLNEFSIKK